MSKSIKIKKLLTIFKFICISIIIFVLLTNPKANMQSFKSGIILWAEFVLPALFPLLFLSSLLNNSGIANKMGNIFAPITTKLFNCSGASGYIYLLSILSGYPVGAKATSELYQNNTITYDEACRITAFASTSGPLFIIGTVGIGMFNSVRIGILILISHFLSAIINGIIFRKLYHTKKNIIKTNNLTLPNNILEHSMTSSINGILTIGAYIALSYMLISLISSYNLLLPISTTLNTIFGLDINISNSILEGLIEITKGAENISKLGLTNDTSAIITTGIITFGGLSIFLQAYTYLARFKIKLKIYFLQKILHTILSIIICSILTIIF